MSDFAAPTAPPVILQLLSKLGVSCAVHPDTAQIAAHQRLQALLLEDAVGAMLVILPQDQLLDLAQLAEITGRKLVVVKTERLQRMLQQHGLSRLPALPSLTSAPCVYDERLLAQPQLFIESGHCGVLLEIAQADLLSLLDKARAVRLGPLLAEIRPNLDRPDDDRAEITQAVQAFTARRIQQRLEQTLEIPPLPETAQKIIKLRVDANTTTEDITGLVETDPALAAQVLSWAASPYYAAPGKVRSVEDAIVRVLGFELVINLALGLALGKTLSLPKDQPQQARPYWQQAIYSAALIEGLTRAMPRETRPEAGLAYLAGLLHNFGYLVLAHVFPPHFSLICRHLEVNPHLEHGVVEQHLLGITREQIGAWLMRFWGVPQELSTALRFQHQPDYQGEHAVYANLLCLTSHLLRQRGLGDGPDRPIPDSLYQRLGLTPAKAEAALDKIQHAEAALRELASQFPQG
jgi:HD-like signal output (HDOD) protein/prolyl-tRNA editing enzyme YbaK/EbsC (Cys-tRNA(Pro) deacylase)